MQHGKKQMLYGNILVSHLLCLIFGTDQGLIQILAYKYLTALHLHALLHRVLCPAYKMLLLNLHLLDEL